MQLLDSKALLAKLMATENITIEQRNVPTAAFDVKNRVLVVPALDKKISGHLYDLFMGHEVGHALYTPLDGVLKAAEQKVNRSVLNVVEDCRIERKIRYKYPGLRNSFVKGYKELLDRDFFGTKGVDLNTLNFIDRINMHTKGGASLGIKFDEIERELLSAVESAETYDEVIEVTNRIVEYMKQQQEEQKVNMPEYEFDDENEGNENFGDFDEWEDGEESEDEADGTGSSKNDFGDEESSEDDEINQDGHYAGDFRGSYKEDSNIRALTQEAYKSNESKLFDSENTNYLYLNVPKIDLDKAVMDYKVFWKKYKESHAEYVDSERFLKIRKETNKVTSYLVKEFEMRKNAEQLKRATVAKTGELNMSKIYSYKFNDDIFKKMTIVPGGKSHGLVLFLDWSGSMTEHLDNTIKQLLSLVMFCKKTNIPFEVYAFAQTETYDGAYSSEFKLNDLHVYGFRLNNLLSSRMTAAEFTYAASALVLISKYPRYAPQWTQLGGTPLNEAVICAMEIIPQFQKKYKLQIVNTVFLTDGEGHSIREYCGIDKESGQERHMSFGRYSWNGSGNRIVFTDPLNKKQEMIENNYGNDAQTAALIKLLKYRTNCNVLGFYILSGRDFGKYCYKFFPMLQGWQMQDVKIKFRKEKSMILTNSAFDEYYLLRSEGMDTEEQGEFEVKENATTRGIASAFAKYSGNKLSSRVVLNRFIGMIA